MYRDFIPYLYSEHSVPEIIKSYATPLLISQNPLERHRATCLLNYLSTISDREFLLQLQELFNKLNIEIRRRYPQVPFSFSGRIKSLFSVIYKLEKLENAAIESGKSWEIENPFARIHDFFAFRLILEDVTPAELIVELYKIANFLIDYFVESGFELFQCDPLIGTGTISQNDPRIYVPKESFLKSIYVPYVKDYVVNPKKEGYQSLHIVFREPFSQRLFEVQIRTRSMELIADTVAAHSQYKEQEYGKPLNIESEIEFSKIHIRGFRVIQYMKEENGVMTIITKIHDQTGLKNPIDIMKLWLGQNSLQY